MATSARRPLRQRQTTLSATDEFWRSPVLNDFLLSSPTTNIVAAAPAAPAADEAAAPALAVDDDDDDDDDFFEVITLPDAHRQLLSDDRASFEDLKGHDHRWDVIEFPDKAWLFGLERLSVEDVPRKEEELTVPGLVCDSDEGSASTESAEGGSLTFSISERSQGGVSFDSVVKVQPIPHCCTLTAFQRRRMYSSSMEVRRNKIRNKKEYRYDGYDWRNAKEEWEMGVDMVTGDLVHPAHEWRGEE